MCVTFLRADVKSRSRRNKLDYAECDIVDFRLYSRYFAWSSAACSSSSLVNGTVEWL